MLGSRRGRDKFRHGATKAGPPGFAGAKTTTDKVTGLLSDKVGISPTWSGQVDRLRSGQAGQVSTGHYLRNGARRTARTHRSGTAGWVRGGCASLQGLPDRFRPATTGKERPALEGGIEEHSQEWLCHPTFRASHDNVVATGSNSTPSFSLWALGRNLSSTGGTHLGDLPFNIAASFETPFCEPSLSLQDCRRNPKRRGRVPAWRFSEASKNSLDLGAVGGTHCVQFHVESKAALDPE